MLTFDRRALPSPAGTDAQLCVVESFVVQYRHVFGALASIDGRGFVSDPSKPGSIGATAWRDVFDLADEDEATEVAETMRGESAGTHLQWRVVRRVRVRA